jgi:hypothetical protein
MPRWDIDKALTDLEDSETPGSSAARQFMDITLFEKHKIKPTRAQVESRGGFIWCLALGRYHDRKLFVYAARIREAYLRARRQIKSMSVAERASYGLKMPSKSNSYAVARRKKKSK